jgi:hypothetical protein
MPGKRAPNDTRTVTGTGATAADALRSLITAVVATMVGAARRPGDHAIVVRASAATLERLIPDIVAAMLGAGEDIGLDLTDATLDGLIATDDGWRAWGTISGERATGAATSGWRVGATTVEERSGSIRLSLSLERIRTDG